MATLAISGNIPNFGFLNLVLPNLSFGSLILGVFGGFIGGVRGGAVFIRYGGYLIGYLEIFKRLVLDWLDNNDPIRLDFIGLLIFELMELMLREN